MLIVVEGADRTGKSSLVETLAGPRDVVIHWERPLRRTAVEEYVEPLMAYEPGEGRNVFCDRHFLGELVWPGIFGREGLVTDADRECIELFLASRGALCLLAWREPGDLEAACVNEPCAGRAAEAQDRFEEAAGASTLPWWRWEHGQDAGPMLAAAASLEEMVTGGVEAAVQAMLGGDR